MRVAFTIERKICIGANGRPETERDERFDPDHRDGPRPRLTLTVRAVADIDWRRDPRRLDCMPPVWWARQRLACDHRVEIDSSGALLVYGEVEVEAVRALLADQPPLMIYTSAGYQPAQ